MSDDKHETKSDSSIEFEDLTSSKIFNYLNQVNNQIDSNPIKFDDLLEQNKVLGNQIDLISKENQELKEKIANMDGDAGQLSQNLLILNQKLMNLQELNNLLKTGVEDLQKENARLQSECTMTENLWKDQNSKCKLLEEKLKFLEEKTKLNEEKLKEKEDELKRSNEEKLKLQSRISQMIKENDDLAQIVQKAYQKMNAQKQQQESEIAIIREMLDQRNTEVQNLKEKILTLQKSLAQIQHENERKQSDEEIDFVLSRGPSRANDNEAFERKLSQSGRSISCEPWIMKQSRELERISDQQRSQYDAQLMDKMEDDLNEHILKVKDLSEKLSSKQAELQKTNDQLSKVQQSLQQQIQCNVLSKQITENLMEEHKKQVTFYVNQLTEFTQMHNSQLETFEFHKKRSEKLQKYLNYPAVVEGLVQKLKEEKNDWETKMREVSEELEETKKKLREKNEVLMEKSQAGNSTFSQDFKPEVTVLETEQSLLRQQLSQFKERSVLEFSEMEKQLSSAKQQISQLETQNLHLENSLQRMEQSVDEQLKEIESLKKQIDTKVSLINSLQNQLNDVRSLYEKEMQNALQHKQVVVQLTENLQQERREKQRFETNETSSKDFESELRDQIVTLRDQLAAQINQASKTQLQNVKLAQDFQQLKKIYIDLQQQKDSFEVQVHRLRELIPKVEKAFNQDFDKIEQQNHQLLQTNHQLRQTNTNLHQKHQQRSQELQKLRTEFNQTKSANLAKTQQLNRKIVSAQSEIMELTEQLRVYEMPMSNQERFVLLRKWFTAKDWKKEQKCDFMGWTEEFFRQYAKIYCDCGEVDDINMVNSQYN